MSDSHSIRAELKEQTIPTFDLLLMQRRLLIIVITLLFSWPGVFFTGFTHDILLEAGVFLVSVKLILMSYKNKVASDEPHKELGRDSFPDTRMNRNRRETRQKRRALNLNVASSP